MDLITHFSSDPNDQTRIGLLRQCPSSATRTHGFLWCSSRRIPKFIKTFQVHTVQRYCFCCLRAIVSPGTNQCERDVCCVPSQSRSIRGCFQYVSRRTPPVAPKRNLRLATVSRCYPLSLPPFSLTNLLVLLEHYLTLANLSVQIPFVCACSAIPCELA